MEGKFGKGGSSIKAYVARVNDLRGGLGARVGDRGRGAMPVPPVLSWASNRSSLANLFSSAHPKKREQTETDSGPGPATSSAAKKLKPAAEDRRVKAKDGQRSIQSMFKKV